MRRGRDDRGSVTAELALTLPAVVLVLGMVLAALAWAMAHLNATDLAGAAARTAAVEGEAVARAELSSQVADASVSFRGDGAWVAATVTVNGPAWLPEIRARAVAFSQE